MAHYLVVKEQRFLGLKDSFFNCAVDCCIKVTKLKNRGDMLLQALRIV
jgi:hypothetical protein